MPTSSGSDPATRGRCVVVAGLPFANRGDPRLVEKINFIQTLPAPPVSPWASPGFHPGELLLSFHSLRPATSAQRCVSAQALPAGAGGADGLDADAAARAAWSGGAGAMAQGFKAGQEFYQNMCMKAVNQCVGRAIRHVGDYAAIVLVDQRYASAAVRAKVAGWISRRLSLESPTTFGPCFSALAAFFRGKKTNQDCIEAERRAAVRERTEDD